MNEMNPWIEWLFAAEQAVCKHEDWQDESYGGPECGVVEGHCPTCGFAVREVLY